jgi:multisubunit Na+/H+ antiporter MnhC subunit
MVAQPPIQFGPSLGVLPSGTYKIIATANAHHLLGAGDFYWGIGAAVGLLLMLLLSIKLYREGRDADRLAKDGAAGRHLGAVYRAHPEARPLPKWAVLTAFIVLACAVAALLIASRMKGGGDGASFKHDGRLQERGGKTP